MDPDALSTTFRKHLSGIFVDQTDSIEHEAG
jgi:hypothetical protein